MRLNNGMKINEKGHLTISGCDTVLLKEQYGTPLYVIDENTVRLNCKKFISAMDKYFKGGRVNYASKALNNKAILKIVASEGLGIDVVSGGELYTALSAGISPNKIELHGNSKTEEEIIMAVENQIYCIIADGFDELNLIESVCQKLNKKINVTIRIRPNIDIHAHEAIQTAKMDCKFGFGLFDGQAYKAAEIINASKFMSLHGVHCHIGSQIFDEQPFGELAKHIVGFANDIKNKLNVQLKEFNFGGGFGVWYTDEDTPKDFEVFIKLISDVVNDLCEKSNYEKPIIAIEPGRSIIAEAGTTLYNVNGLKEIKEVRTYCMSDGGMFENVRLAMYGSKYTAYCASKMNEEHNKLVSIAGKCCESGDMISWDTPMPESLKVNDTLAVLTTGAYNYSMASNYNRNPVPAMVLIKDGESNIISKRQSYEYITMNDVVPDYLK